MVEGADHEQLLIVGKLFQRMGGKLMSVKEDVSGFEDMVNDIGVQSSELAVAVQGLV